MTPHRFTLDETLPPDPLSFERFCKCGLPSKNRVHKLPERSDEERAAEERRIGDR